MFTFSLFLIVAYLTFCGMCLRSSGYVIADKNMVNLDIKLRLVKAGDKSGSRIKFKGGVDLIINGQRINSKRKGDVTFDQNAGDTRSFPDVSEESLAARPLKYLLDKSQMQL